MPGLIWVFTIQLNIKFDEILSIKSFHQKILKLSINHQKNKIKLYCNNNKIIILYNTQPNSKLSLARRPGAESEIPSGDLAACPANLFSNDKNLFKLSESDNLSQE
ncbi:hypothetical protein BpHYR1_038835 [Brachionus plicatilis]|uniref:Uncharacterized protein n=1 Tax=Brachionus plicatilis TaxID=10195 RepID=A0A3M7SAN3_BRAPC|nr:hypothetical protein BpHYR1_038835 [Brachionus plicatilis]